MRRQARISGGGALVLRSASALQVWLWILIFVFQNEFRISRSIQPGYLDFDNLPETNFTCEGKVIGGYYADLETSCQMFHVCTVGQQEEPMDIKFLCLNGTVFDQETRVCERVDEVDCTKSEKFYSLNLELYGSTAPPIIKLDQPKIPSTEQTTKTTSTTSNYDDESDPSIDDTYHHTNKDNRHSNEDSTEDPTQEIHNEQFSDNGGNQSNNGYDEKQSDHVEPVEENQEEEEINAEEEEYEDEVADVPPTTTQRPPTTTRKPPSTTVSLLSSSLTAPIISTSPTFSSSPKVSLSSQHNSDVSSSTQTTLDPALLSPQEFIYHHRGPGSEAISFQRQSFRPADGVYITNPTPHQQYDHFQYESSRTAPRPGAAPFVQRPPPSPFRASTIDPRDQMTRPISSTQPSERHETLYKHRPQSYLPPPPASVPFDNYYFHHKKSDDIPIENESYLAARSVAPPPTTEKSPVKPKSPPRVIVTASASVSDSNGKRLNYTVGNVVSAVKPIVPINYDDYKESDLIFDPFFLDVPKLQKRRKSRENVSQQNKVYIPSGTGKSGEINYSNLKRLNSKSSNKHKAKPTTTRVKLPAIPTTTVAWSPLDYVDDNYEPQAYVPPIHPIAILMMTNEKTSRGKPISNETNVKKLNKTAESHQETSPSAQSTSSQLKAAALNPTSLIATGATLLEKDCVNSGCGTATKL